MYESAENQPSFRDGARLSFSGGENFVLFNQTYYKDKKIYKYQKQENAFFAISEVRERG